MIKPEGIDFKRLGILTAEEAERHTGAMMCAYSGAGAGKTVSSLKSLAVNHGPVLWIFTEKREPMLAIDAAGLDVEKDVFVHKYKNFNHLLGTVLQHKELLMASGSILVDSITDLITVKLPKEFIEKEAGLGEYASGKKKENPDSIYDAVKMSQPVRGMVNQAIFRTLNILGDYVQTQGKPVVVLAGIEDKAKKVSLNDEVAVYRQSPSLSGGEVPKAFAGFFDFIGKVESRYDKIKKDKAIYPPLINFTKNKSFVSKYTGSGDKTVFPLDLDAILNHIHGKGGDK